MNRADFDRYIALFNARSLEQLRPYYTSDVRLDLPTRTLEGPDAIIAFYSNAAEFREEYLETRFLMMSEHKIAVELYTEFRCIKDFADFVAMPLKPGDIYVMNNFVFYELEGGKFKVIRVAQYRSDLSRVASLKSSAGGALAG